MKRFAGFLAMIGLMLFAVQAQAVTLGQYAKGALVPSVIHDGAAVDTVVGILCQIDCTTHVSPTDDANTKVKIHWTFFDVDSHHVTDGVIGCTDDDLVGFSWKASAGRNLENVPGYLVFQAQGEIATISANAFLVDQNKNDAIFIPVIPLTAADFAGAPATEPDAVMALTNGIRGGTPFDVRYWMDPTYNAGTSIVVWLVDPYVNADGKAVPVTVMAWNDNEVPKSITISLPHELNKIVPCEIPGMPLDFVDGFISMAMPASIDGFAYSYISSSLFGAQQTLLAAECGDVRAPSTPTPPADCGCQGAGY